VKLNELPTAQEYTLIALYVGSMLGSTLLFSFVTDKQQKYMLAAMPIIFVPFVLNFSTGVMIYWITSNLWTIGQQGTIKRTMGHRFPQPAGKGSGGKGGSSGKGASPSKSGKPKSGTDGGKPADEPANAAPTPRRGGNRRSAPQAGRRSGQRRGGRKR
jgi:YidC/Oxa1 family membrane protein insertase